MRYWYYKAKAWLEENELTIYMTIASIAFICIVMLIIVSIIMGTESGNESVSDLTTNSMRFNIRIK